MPGLTAVRLRPYGRRLHPAVVVTPVALAVALWGLDRPSLWLDEAATWSAAGRPLDELLVLAGQKDRALFPYYLFMHAWTRVSVAEAWLRLPSALAAAAAAGFTAALGARLWSPRAGLVAGLVLVLLPDWSRYAQEARPYALALMFTTAAAWALVRAVDSEDWWPVYTVAIVGAVAAHFLTLLVLCAHAGAVAARSRYRTRAGLPPWPGVRSWGESVGFAAVPAAAFVLWAVSQPTAQLSWSRPALPDLWSAWSQVVGSWEVAALLAATAAACARRRAAPVLLVGWLLVPPVALFAAAQATPLWAPRYLLFVLPAGVLLAAIPLASARTWVPVAAVAGVAALTVPLLQGMRGPAGHGQDYRAAAAVIRRDTTPRTAVLLSPSWQRSGLAYYLDGAAADVMTAGPRPAGALHAPEAPAATAAARLAAFDRVWWVGLGERPRPLDARDRAKKRVLDRWFRPVRAVRPGGLILTLYER